MPSKRIDINCDMGESFGQFKVGNDEAIFPYITSCNIACGFHGGDPFHMEKTIQLAMHNNVQIGAHPSYPDLAGFGRRNMKLERAELKAMLKYQIAALKGMAESMGGRLSYVKPHGALYNTAAADESETLVIIEAMHAIDPALKLMCLAGSLTEQIALRENVPFVAEAFADRRYDDNGHLVSRNEPGAVIHEPAAAADQVLSMVLDNTVRSINGTAIPIAAQSICIHGDNPAAVAILQALSAAFQKNNITKASF